MKLTYSAFLKLASTLGMLGRAIIHLFIIDFPVYDRISDIFKWLQKPFELLSHTTQSQPLYLSKMLIMSPNLTSKIYIQKSDFAIFSLSCLHIDRIMSLQNVFAEVQTPNWTVFGSRPFKKVNEFKWSQEWHLKCAFEEEEETRSRPLPMKRSHEDTEKMTICKPKSETTKRRNWTC